MLYTNYNNKELQGIVISCSCGCSNLEINTIDDVVYVHVYGSDFYNYQGLGTLRDNVSNIVKKVKKKDLIFTSVFLSLDETKQFLKLAKQLPFGKNTNDVFKNFAHLELEYVHLFDDKPTMDECDLSVVLNTSLIDLIRNKGFKGAEICLKKNEWFKLITNFEIAFEEKYNLYNNK